jgi:hypothetical protein
MVPAAVRTVEGMRCSSCLQARTIAAPVAAAVPLLADVALTALCEWLPQLQKLRLSHHQFSLSAPQPVGCNQCGARVAVH